MEWSIVFYEYAKISSMKRLFMSSTEKNKKGPIKSETGVPVVRCFFFIQDFCPGFVLFLKKNHFWSLKLILQCTRIMKNTIYLIIQLLGICFHFAIRTLLLGYYFVSMCCCVHMHRFFLQGGRSISQNII